MSIARGALVFVLLSANAGQVSAQSTDGADVFRRSCAACHSGAADARAPALDALRSRTPQAVIESLMTGAMRAQGSRLSGAERRAVAEFVTGKAVGGDVQGAEIGRCTTAGPPDADPGARWSGWGPDVTNTRLQPAAGLTLESVPRLTLKWALGFPDASAAWAPPTVARGRLFVGSQNGTVYALDARRGCVYWTFSAAGGVRTAITVAGDAAAGDTAVDDPAAVSGVLFFGDTSAHAYALDLATGREIWRRRVDDHALARITGSLTLHAGRVYVPMSSYEESQGADPQYACCTFRGSVTALDARSGRVVWKTSMIDAPLERRGTSSAGVPLWGPSGSAIWSPPTVDERRRLLYVATGNMYSGPSQPSSNAVVALDLDSGAIRWMRQITPGDVYVSGCRAGNANCPAVVGPDHDFGSPPALVRAGDRDLLVIGQKSGLAFAMDPDRGGEIVWQYRAGQGGVLGGIEWGAAVDDRHAYFAVSDILGANPGGLHAVHLATGLRAWATPAPTPICLPAGAVARGVRGCNGAQSAAVTAIPGVVFSGSNDGALRAYSAADGAIVWEFDTNREFQTVNGVPARGASILGPGPVVAGGMVYTNSGYGAFGGRPGNVLLAFGLE